VAGGGGTGTANPSISGGTGLENLYVADGVNITDGGFGGIGVYSRLYGSLGTGLNLSFVKEVQVKTGGFEAQYGRSSGGIVQIVTKSGGNDFHGSIGGYFAPDSFEATRRFTDDFGLGTQQERFNLQGKVLHQSNYDVAAEVGGHVPGFKDKLFFFGSFNPQWNTDHDQYAQLRNSANCPGATAGPCTGDSQPPRGNINISQRVYSYDAKLTWKATQNHQFESSVFGDPTYGDNAPNGPFLVVANHTVDDKLQFGTRSFVVRYNGALTPSWLVNASWTWGHNNINDKPVAPDIYGVADITQNLTCGAPAFNVNCLATTNPGRGQFQRQGFGYYENTQGDNYGLNIDTSKAFRFLGEHNVTVGYNFARGHYDGLKSRSGANIAVDAATACGGYIATLADPTCSSPDSAALVAKLVANGTNAAFQLRSSAGQCTIAEIYIPGWSNGCADGGFGVVLRQTRGEFGDLNFKTTSNYHTLYAQDAWSINKYVTVNAGLRWEQQQVQGTTISYTMADNWSPRVGISVDPWGNRKTKIFANFGRYTETLPLDVAIRSLSNELDFGTTNWRVPNDGAGHALLNADGTIDMSSMQGTCPTCGGPAPTDPNGGFILAPLGGISAQSTTGFAPGTRSEYLDEYVVGMEHEFGNSGIIFTARYTDRRIKRIIEDMAALSPEAFQCCLNQNYLIGNPSKTQDIFINPIQFAFNSGGTFTAPAGSPCDPAVNPDASGVGVPTDSNGNGAINGAGDDAFCVTNSSVAGLAGSDGIPDGFVNPIRIYKSMEFEVNKSFSKNWQMRANYRIAKLFGNYEGSFRNDNGQNDPNISSLFDFTQGQFNLLGGQFSPGVLNTDVRHLANGFVSYTFGNHYMKGLTMGTSVHFQTGIPINNLFAHPAYQNSGEIPVCADGDTSLKSCNGNPRGSLGRTQNWGSVDFHADYPIRLTERTKIRLAADLFNLTDQRTLLRVDQLAQRTIGSQNVDFGKPTGIGPSAVTGNTNPGYQRPFYARFGVRFEF